MASSVALPAGRQLHARSPFCFNSAAHLLRITGDQATTLRELLEALRSCPDECIFQHTFQTLEEHHFVREGFSNDFAHWTFSACNEAGLAERLASVDIREYSSISALRQALVSIVEPYLRTNSRAAERPATEPFHFCATDTVVVPTSFLSNTLEEFAGAIRAVSIYSLHYHFIEARLRLGLNSNDFSVWLERDLDLPAAAQRVNRIDIYTSTLQDIRRKILRILEEPGA
jgi:hypothetical protein